MKEWLQFLSRPRFSPESVQRYQDARVRRLVKHAWLRVPYYKRLLDQAGIRPDDIGGTGDLRRIPVTRKRDLQQVPFEERVASGTDLRKCIVFTTSGSTGEPLRMLRTRREQYLLFGFRLRAQVVSGLRPMDRRVKLGSAQTLLLPHRLGFFRTSNIPLDLGPKETLKRLKEIRPGVIYGIPNMFAMLLATASREELAALHPRLVFSGAELLGSSLRGELESVFQCPVVDFYGCHELNLIAWQCRKCGVYHTSDDSLVVEVLKDGLPVGPGQEGEIFVTGLHSYAMPLIRMEIGDVVRRPAGARACTIGFGGIDRICGRAVEFLPLPDGTLLSPWAIMDEIEEAGAVRQFRIAQEAPDRIVVFFVPLPESPAFETAQRIAERCRTLFPPQVAIEARPVSSIPPTAAGKFRLVQAYRSDGPQAHLRPAP